MTRFDNPFDPRAPLRRAGCPRGTQAEHEALAGDSALGHVVESDLGARVSA